MKQTFFACCAVARTTLLEALQQPIALLLFLCGFELICLQPLLQLHTFGEAGRLTRDCGMGVLLLFGVLLCALTAGKTMTEELRNGTGSLALVKPLSRSTYLAGKMLGLFLLMALFSWCCTGAVLFACRTAEAYVHTARFTGEIRDYRCGMVSLLLPLLCLGCAALLNALSRRRLGLWFILLLTLALPLSGFVLGFLGRDGAWHGLSAFAMQLDFRLVAAALPICFLLFLFSALAITFSMLLSGGAAAVFLFGILFLGFLAEHLSNQSVWGLALYAVIPDVQHFWLLDRLAAGGTIPLAQVSATAGYALFSSLFLWLLSCMIFRGKDLS